jgi:Tol biopolymer transport system component
MVVVLWQMLAPSPITITTSNIRAVTSEPGVEWQPALSPDGSQVAFVAMRGGRQTVVLKSTLNIAGELVPTMGLHDYREVFPAWSADGEFVRFCGGPNAPAWGWIVNPRRLSQCKWMETGRLGGSVRPIDLPGSTALPTWSPDGSRIAFIAMPDSIFALSLADGAATLVTTAEVTWGVHSLVWSPDGKWIAYVSGNPWWLNSFNVLASSIWIVSGDGGEPMQATGGNFSDVSPAWLDDNHLLFVSNRDGPREVYVVEVTPTGPRGEPRKVPGVIDPHTISYSIEGRKLAFAKATVRQNIRSYPVGSGLVSVADGRPVTSENAVIESHEVSPDGEWIAYASNLRGNMDIYKRRLEGGTPIQVTDSPTDEGGPCWSPDASEIAFFGDVGGTEAAVMVVPADGGTPIQLANGQIDFHPVWSPSGLDIVFRSDRAGREEAWIVSREAVGEPWGEATRLADTRCVPSDWAPDGSGVLCESGMEEVLVSPEGEVLWRYDLATAGLRISPGRPKFSYDGSTIYIHGIHEDGVTGIWAIPRQGGEPRLVVVFDDAELAGQQYFSVGSDHLYVTVAEHESDIWVMDVEVER